MAYPCFYVTKTLLMRLKINPRWRTVRLFTREIFFRSKTDTKILLQTSMYYFGVSFKQDNKYFLLPFPFKLKQAMRTQEDLALRR